MSIISRGFSGRRSAESPKLPPGQHLTTDVPVLSAGPTPHIPFDSEHRSIPAQPADDGRRFDSAPAGNRDVRNFPPAGTVGGDLYEYINFQQRYDFHARNEKPTKDFVAATPCAESAAIGYISSLASLKKSIDDSTSPQELRSRL